jgi:hypothetical protein
MFAGATSMPRTALSFSTSLVGNEPGLSLGPSGPSDPSPAGRRLAAHPTTLRQDMFRDSGTIAKAVAVLEARNVSLWHACQLRDLDAYLQVGGVPSRRLLERRGVAFTPFVTDAIDRRNGVWNKVFVNLADFGATFAHGCRSVPNPYGPIALQLRPTALLESADAAICLRSAGASDFDRDVESLADPADVDRLFAHPPEAGVFKAMEPLFGERLRDTFAPRYPYATSPEASLSIPAGHLGWGYLVAVWVDPVIVGDRSLLGAVRERIDPAVPVLPRWLADDRRLVYDDIQRVLAEGMPPLLRLLRGRADVSPVTREWAAAVADLSLDWQFERFARYLVEGTIGELREPAAAPRAATARSVRAVAS